MLARPPCITGFRRIGLGLNFIPTHVRTTGGWQPAAMLVRGMDRFGHFELLQPPEMELDYAAVRTYAHAAGPYRDIDVEQEAKHSAWAGADNVKLST